MSFVDVLRQTLLVFGVGFLVANLVRAVEIVRWVRRRSTALIAWPGRKPPLYGLSLGIALMLGVLILVKAYFLLPQVTTLGGALGAFGRNAFGELMMFVYFGYMLPLSTRIARGMYADGVWTDTGFMPYEQIGGISWREGDRPTLVVISRRKTLARRLEIPGQFLGEVRRLLRDKISSHRIEMESGPGLHLGERDVRDSV